MAAALADARAAFVAANPNSRTRFEAAARVMPGGNTRTVLFYEPFPLCIARGEGAQIWDVDGHAYLDFLGEFTAGIFGHSDPRIRAAIDAALDGGINLSGHNTLEAELAAIVCARFPSIERVRFTNSGTEANLLALAAATVHTGRRKVMVFEGAYHGGVLSFGAGPAPVNVPHDWVLAPYNDLAGTEALIAEHAPALAAILVEPMQGSSGCIPADREFLQMLRDEATRHGAILIFDEVMTSRLSPGGLQQALGIIPDMTTLGKYIGGGMSFGAFGGRSDIMDIYDPSRPGAMPHAGTFNNNVLTMSAGIAALSEVFTPDAAEALHARGDRFRQDLNALFARHNAPLQVTGQGSLMNLHAMRGPIRGVDDLTASDDRIKELIFLDLLERGFYMARRGFIALSLALTDDHLAGFIAALEATIRDRAAVLADVAGK